MCHMITTHYPQQMASDLRLIEIHSRFAQIVEEPVYYSGVYGERFKEYSIEWDGYDYNVYFDKNREMCFEEVEMLLGVAGIIKPKDVEFAEGECDDCGDYCVCDIHLPSGETVYFETHFGNTNFPNDWGEFFEIVEREREVLRSRL